MNTAHHISCLTTMLFALTFGLLACGGGGGCDGTIFVNLSTTESVTVSAGETSELSFASFTLEAGAQRKVCGDDSLSIMGTYTWPNSDTASLGQTSSSGDICIFLTEEHTATSGSAGSC